MQRKNVGGPDKDDGSLKGVQTLLDTLPAGTDESMLAGAGGKYNAKDLPDGISSKGLYGDVFRIAWPALVEQTLTSLVSMVDMMMVGVLGSAAISAVGLATQPRFIFMTLVMSMNTGATAIIARARGVKDHERVNNILKHSLLLTLFICILCTTLGVVFAEPLVRFMSAGGLAEATIKEGTKYLQIQMWGFSFMSFTLVITAAFRGTGNSRISMVYNITMNIVNIIFNWLLIGGNLGFPALGVAGASLATVIGQVVGCAMAFYCILSKKYYLRLTSFRKFKVDTSIFKGIANVGIPAMGEQFIMRIGMIIFSRIIASLGEVQMATHQICMNIQSLTFMNGQAFAVSATTLVGQSLGKKRGDMAEHYSRRCRRLGLYVSVFLMVVFALFSRQLVGLYSTEPEVIDMGARIMLFIAAIQPIQCSQFILAGALRGAGDTRATAVITLLTVLLLRPILGYILVNNAGLALYGAWIAMAADQCLRSLLVLLRYRTGKWKFMRVY